MARPFCVVCCSLDGLSTGGRKGEGVREAQMMVPPHLG